MQKKSAPSIPRAAAAAAILAACAADAPARADEAFRRFERPAELARDENLNRAVTRSPTAFLTSATSQGNLVSVRQEGRGNTLMLNLEQTNTGAVSANARLNGQLRLD